jgi:hypothetical protein
MRADDDGFVGNPKRIARMIGASEDDLNVLIAKRFVLTFANGVIVIKHWRMHNTLSSGRYHETQYVEEKSTLLLKENKSYSFKSGVPINDSKLLEMYSENKRRTNGERVENSDIDIDIDLDLDLGLDKDLDSGLNKKNTSAQSHEPKPITSEPHTDVEALILNTGEEWRPKESDFEEYLRLYPGINVRQEFAKMRAWCINNPTKRKTRNGVKRFVGGWLGRAQDESTRKGTENKSSYIDAVKNRVSEVDDWV